uniref:Putative malectin n=1 Tax=Ixodes ricinus TaxID=34613 RepID=A0A147BFA9_IXORI
MFACSAVPLFLALCILHLCDSAHSLGDVIYAINAGGEEHVDVHGIHYKRDPLFGKTGTASDYGKLLVIGRVPKSDHILYQTERYHTATFGYDIPVNKDGNYVLVLKFSEVYFDSPGRKVFDVTLNGQHAVITGLDIYNRVGRGVAHDERIPFVIKGNKLFVGNDESTHDGKIKVEFIKGYRDNPKINAIYVIRGTEKDLPPDLPPIEEAEEEQEEELETDVPMEAPQDPAAAEEAFGTPLPEPLHERRQQCPAAHLRGHWRLHPPALLPLQTLNCTLRNFTDCPQSAGAASMDCGIDLAWLVLCLLSLTGPSWTWLGFIRPSCA